MPVTTRLVSAGSDENLPAALKPRVSYETGNRYSPIKRRKRTLIDVIVSLLRRKSQKISIDEDSRDYPMIRKHPCRMTFIFDPAGRLCYYWSFLVSMAFLYNLWVISYRFAFDEIRPETRKTWFILDYGADLIYILDLVMGFRTGFFQDGVLLTNPTKIRLHFTNTATFYLDCLSLLPFDFLYLSFGYQSIVRFIRLVKIYKFWRFVDISERHSNYPNAFRSAILMHYLLLVFHWNACIIYAFRESYAPREDNLLRWNETDKLYNYLNAYSISCTILLLSQTDPVVTKNHRTKKGLALLIVQQTLGLLMLATVLGYVANIVANRSSDRKQFQRNLDGVKTYMRHRRVPNYLQMKVIRWFDFLWRSKNTVGEESDVLQCLPDKLKAEIAIQVHLNTLKRVEIFRNTEPGFLCELVLRLRPLLFSPGDYVCRKGEVGKEMYIVNTGKLRVLNDEIVGGVLATLSAGTYFGEISLLNLGSEGNRRTASVVSVGYSELLCLAKKDIYDVLEDYPTARERLEEIAHRRLQERKAQKNVVKNQNQPVPPLLRRASAPVLTVCNTRIGRLSLPATALGPPASKRSTVIHPFIETPTIEENSSAEEDQSI